MSAPLGRIIDRHIKIVRFSRHPLVISGETIPEPLIHILAEEKGGTASNVVRRSQRRAGPRKTERNLRINRLADQETSR